MTILLVAILISILLGRITVGPLFFLVAFPGVVLHEFAHFLVALVLGARPTAINLIPKRDGPNGWILGSVPFNACWWSSGFVALAPLFLLPLLGWALFSEADNESWLQIGLVGYAIGCISWACIPSRTDWALAFRYPFGTVVLFSLAFYALKGFLQTLLAN